MANRYITAAGGNYNSSATWETSPGAADSPAVPTSSDAVIGTALSGNLTITASAVAQSVDLSAYVGTLTHNAFSWSVTNDITFGAGMTYAPLSTSTIVNSGTCTFITAGNLIPNLLNSGAFTVGDNITFMDSKVISWTIATSSTISLNGFTVSGFSSTSRVRITSNVLGTARTITAANVSISNADFRDITGAGAANWDLSAITGLSGDCGGNTNITFTTAATQTYTGGTGSWSDVTKWTSRVPLPQDDVSMSGVTGGTITADMPRLGKSIDWTGASGSPTWSVNTVAMTVYGSLTMISAMTFTSNQVWTFEGRSSFTLTSAGKIFGGIVNISLVGGTITAQDAMANSASDFTLTNGTFDWGSNLTHSSLGITISGTATKQVNMNNSQFTLNRSSGNPFNLSGATGTTINSGSSTIFIANTGVSTKTFAGAGFTYNDLKLAGGGAGAVILTGANTFNRIYTDGGGTKSITLPGSTTTTLLSGSGLGNGTNVITFTASAGSATVAKSGGGTVGYDYVHLTNIIASTANTWYAGTHSTDNGGNTNWIFTAVPADYYSASINDFKQAWYASRGYTRTLNDNELAYFNTQNSTTFISIRDAKERYFINLGYSGTLGDMYYKSLLTTMGLSASSFSLTDVERIFYSNTSNEFA